MTSPLSPKGNKISKTPFYPLQRLMQNSLPLSTAIPILSKIMKKLIESIFRSSVDFLQYVSTDKDIRDASSAASTELAKFGVEMGMREDVFKSLSYVEQNTDLSSLSLVDRRCKNIFCVFLLIRAKY